MSIYNNYLNITFVRGWHQVGYEAILKSLKAYINFLASEHVYTEIHWKESIKYLNKYTDPKSLPNDLILWDLGSGDIPWKDLSYFTEINDLLEDIGIQLKWFRLDIRYQENFEYKVRQTVFKFVGTDLSTWFACGRPVSLSFMKNFMQEELCESRWPDIIIAKHFFSRLTSSEPDKLAYLNKSDTDIQKKLIRNGILSFYHALDNGGFFLVEDVFGETNDINAVRDFIKRIDDLDNEFRDYWEDGLKQAERLKISSIIKTIWSNTQEYKKKDEVVEKMFVEKKWNYIPHFRTVESCFGNEMFSHNFLFSVLKEPNIFLSDSIYKRPRKDTFTDKIYSKVSKQVFQAFKNVLIVNHDKNSSEIGKINILDVGVGDGRFSRFFYEMCKKQGWNYHGVEIRNESNFTNHTFLNDLMKKKVAFGSNFFALSSEIKYDAILCFFFFHMYKFHQLTLYKLFQLLKPGGVVAIAIRNDNFAKWRNNYITRYDNHPLAKILKEYWDLRNNVGIRNYDSLDLNVSLSKLADLIVYLGMDIIDVITVLQTSKIKMDDLINKLEPYNDVLFSFARVGMSDEDIQHVKQEVVDQLVRKYPNFRSYDILEQITIYFIQKKA